MTFAKKWPRAWEMTLSQALGHFTDEINEYCWEE